MPSSTQGGSPNSSQGGVSSALGGSPESSQGGSTNPSFGGSPGHGGSTGRGGSAGTESGAGVATVGGTGNPPPPDTCDGALPATFTTTCGACHTAQGTANPRYPDLYQFSGSLDDFRRQVREGSNAGMPAYEAGLVPDADVSAIFAYFTGGNARADSQASLGGVVPLFDANDAVNPPIVFEREDGVRVTRGAGRVRDRHEGPLDTNKPFKSCESCHENNGPGETLSGALGPTSSMAIKHERLADQTEDYGQPD